MKVCVNTPSPGEVRIHELAVANSLTDNSPNELEVIQVIVVYHAQWVRLESRSIGRRSEEYIVWIEYLSGKYHVPA